MNENAGTASSELSVSQLMTGIGKLVFDISKQTAAIAERMESLEGLVSQGLFERLDLVVQAIENLKILSAVPSVPATAAAPLPVLDQASPSLEGMEPVVQPQPFPVESLTAPLRAGLEKLVQIEARIGSIEKAVMETAAAVPLIAAPMVGKLESLEAKTDSIGRDLIKSSDSLAEKTSAEGAELRKLLASQDEMTSTLLEAVLQIGQSSSEISKAALDLPARFDSLNGFLAGIPELVQERISSTSKEIMEPLQDTLTGMGTELAGVPQTVKTVGEAISVRIDALDTSTTETIKGLKDVLDSQQTLLDDMRITIGEASNSQEKSLSEMTGLLSVHREAVLRTQVDDLNNEAIQYFNRGSLEEATASIKAALEIEPGRSELWANAGHVSASSGNLKEAEENFRKALSIDPGLEPALSGLGLLLVRAGRPRDTLEILSRLLEDPAPSSRIALACARAMAAMERHADAIALLERALTADPGNPDLETELASYKGDS